MTENARFKKAVRARAEQTGQKYTQARRTMLAEGGGPGAGPSRRAVEPHYAFTPPETIEYVDGNGSRVLPVPPGPGMAFKWGYAGTGPNTSAQALLLDATGSADRPLSIAFTRDNLDWYDEIGDQAFVITVAEVRAWREEAEPRVRAKQEAARVNGPTVTRLSDMPKRIEAYKQAAAQGPRKPWWQAYRDAHGEPRLG